MTIPLRAVRCVVNDSFSIGGLVKSVLSRSSSLALLPVAALTVLTACSMGGRDENGFGTTGAQIAPSIADRPALMLPTWVQSTRPAALWDEPVGSSVSNANVPAFETLEVLDAQDGRLLVVSEPSQTEGWVDVRNVQPSDAPGQWLQNHRTTRPYANVSDPTPIGPAIAQFTYLRQAGEPDGERIPVQVDPRDARAPTVWVDTDAWGPAGPPRRVVYTGPAGQALSVGTGPTSRDAFLEAVGNAAQASQSRSGVPASVTVAQAILESDWGASALSKVANNYFGIKASGKIGNGGVVWMRTWEVIGGQDVYLQEPFRAYSSLEDSVEDHAKLFTGLRLYAAAMQVVDNPLSFAQAIHAAGYSTDPNYVSKLTRLMDQYNLGRWDRDPSDG
jgi:hypothetical protein